MWEASLSQESYTAAEAAEAMGISETTVRRLLKSGELYSDNPDARGGNPGARGTRIPKAAIIRYRVGPEPLEGLFGKTSE
jgi:excisionase family DNA binding protein